MSNQNIKQIKKTQEEIICSPYKIRITRLKGFKPPSHHLAKFRNEGEFLTVRYTKNKVHTHVKRIDKTHYKTSTGEIREYRVWSEDERLKVRRIALKRTFEELKAVLRENFQSDKKNALFITLTYREHVTDRVKVMKDFDKFFKRLKYAFPSTKFEYVTVVEPHAGGDWHLHFILKSVNQEYLYIHYDAINKLWRNGRTDTRRLKTDDVGRYYTAYFTGLLDGSEYSNEEIEENGVENSGEEIFLSEKEIIEKGLPPKKYIKGARLKYYPEGMRLYRCSNGIVRPKLETRIIGPESDDLKLEFEQSFLIEKIVERDKSKNVSGEIIELNTIYKATYRKLFDFQPAQSIPYDWNSNIVIQAKEKVEQLNIAGMENPKCR